MAVRNISHDDIMRGGPLSFLVNDAVPTEVLFLGNIKDGIVNVNEIIKTEEYEVEDGTEKIHSYARKCTIEFTFSEIDTTDIAAISGLVAGEIIITSDVGGLNSNGKILTMTACDSVQCFIEDMKTKVIAIKTTTDEATLPYTITDVAV